MHFFKTGLLLLLVTVAACTPAFVQQKSGELAQQARLIDGVDIARTHNRLLSRQAQICLVSDAGGTPAGSGFLFAMQAGFSGYFLAVGVESEPMDYLRAVASQPCPTASYLFYVQPIASSGCSSEGQPCAQLPSQYKLTIVNSGDRSLVDRVTLSISSSFIAGGDSAERLQNAFALLAAALTGADGR